MNLRGLGEVRIRRELILVWRQTGGKGVGTLPPDGVELLCGRYCISAV